MIYVTDDTHRNFSWFSPDRFPEWEEPPLMMWKVAFWTRPHQTILKRSSACRGRSEGSIGLSASPGGRRSFPRGENQATDEKHLLLWERIVWLV